MSPDGRPRGAEPAFIDAGRSGTHHYLTSSRRGRVDRADGTDWRLQLDPDDLGLSEGWAERGLPATSVPAEVPGVWNTVAPSYTGVCWYEARFKNQFLAGGAVRVVVGAANYLTDAWLNGVFLGRHEGGYDAFSFRCTYAMQEGENRLTLRIVDPRPESEIDGLRLCECPTAKESWYGGVGGPWDGVWLERTWHVWIADVRAHGDVEGQRATFRVTIGSDRPAPRWTTVRVQVHDPSGAASAQPAVWPGVLGEARADISGQHVDGAVVELHVPVPNPRLWSPETPTLYSWSVTVDAYDRAREDAADGRLGFRTAEWHGGIFYLNGQPRYLKGALLQPTYPQYILAPTLPVRYGVWQPMSLTAEDLRLANDVGINLVRCHLRPPPHDLLSRCDSSGMMLYVEPPLAWIEPSGRLLEHGKRELAAMVRACGNHPSVVLWGIFNENARATEAVGGELMAELAGLDPTRPIIENSGGAAVGETGMWAWGGQSRCWSPGWEAPRPLNDVHIYLANPLRREARELLATVGDGPTLDVTPGRAPADRLESRLSADAVLVSEYGCGALPDFEAALAAFGDETHLADAVLLRDLRDDLARGLEARGLDREIGDVPSLVRETQAFQAEGIIAQTAALRQNPNVSGLILTQLADAGWEQMAGLVGLWRHPRPALEAFKRALQPHLLHVELGDPASSGRVQIRTWLLSEPGVPLLQEPATLTIVVETPTPPHERLRSVAGQPVRLPRVRAGRRGGRLPGAHEGGPLNLTNAPLPSEAGLYQIHARLRTHDRVDEAVCTVRRLPDRAPQTGAGLVLLGHGLRASLPEAQTMLPDGWAGPILAYLPTRPSSADLARAVELARAGAHLCLVGLEPRSAGQLEPLLGLPLRLHTGRGNFMGIHHYVRNHALFDGLGAPCLADSTFAEALPVWVVEELPGAEVLAGCFTVPDGGRGFLWRASVQTLPFGGGRLTLCQFGIGERQGGALGRYLMDTLVGWMQESPRQAVE